MTRPSVRSVDGVLLALMVMHLAVAPFTKVEESFNIQAVHDVLEFGFDVSQYDHLEFPGVVPRTFIGPVLLSCLTAPVLQTLRAIPPWWTTGVPHYAGLLIARFALGLVSVASLCEIRRAVSARYSEVAGLAFGAITASQFHVMFYASRTLPNTFAMIFTNVVVARLISMPDTITVTTGLLGFACALFRSELSILMLSCAITWLCRAAWHHKLVQTIRGPLLKAMLAGLLGGVCAALLSIVVDSYFWRRWAYPELEVFYFNAILNKSHHWGTSPWHWYFSSALPKALGGSLFLVAHSIVTSPQDVAPVLLPFIGFVLIYSVLPHKEIRFVFYAIPALNVAAAISVSNMLRNHSGKRMGASPARLIRWLPLVACISCSVALTTLTTMASARNYPAAYALLRLHDIEETRDTSSDGMQCGVDGSLNVHIDPDAAMTGITRFLELPANQDATPHGRQWNYSRREDLTQEQLSAFEYLVTGRPKVDGFALVHSESGFDGIRWREPWNPIMSSPKVFVHRRESQSCPSFVSDADEQLGGST